MKTDLSPTLRRVRELRAEGKSQRVMADILEAEGVPLPPGRAKKWNHVGVQACLQQLEEWEAPAHDPTPPPSPVPPPAAPNGAPPPPPSPAKPSPTAKMKLQIHGPWRRTDGLLWEFLLHKVWDDLDQKPAHALPIKDALPGLREAPPPHTRTQLCDALNRLARSVVFAVGSDGPLLLDVTTPLISTACTEDTLHFQFPDALLKLLTLPRQLTRLQELLAATA